MAIDGRVIIDNHNEILNYGDALAISMNDCQNNIKSYYNLPHHAALAAK